jgi:hypothetical protein
VQEPDPGRVKMAETVQDLKKVCPVSVGLCVRFVDLSGLLAAYASRPVPS